MEPVQIHNGLETITVAATELSHVDGERGVLILRGHPVERLAPEATFEDVTHLLWSGTLPDATERAAMSARLYAGRTKAFERLADLRPALAARDAMDALRGAAAQLTEQDSADLPGLLAGALAVFVAAHARIRAGLEPIAPRPGSHAADYLAMLFGREPRPSEVRALDTYLVTVADHGLNASTFAARCVISTLTDSVSAVVAAIGSLKGPLHGGAPGAVLEMLDAIGTPDRAESWISTALDRHERIMGMGHRIYRQRDPRADVLEAAIKRLTRDRGGSPRLELARSVETTAARILDERYPGRFLRPNVEFNTAVILEAIGLDRSLFTATFAVSRVAGWLGHIDEQRRTGKLIRPRALYTGPLP